MNTSISILNLTLIKYENALNIKAKESQTLNKSLNSND